MSDKDLLAKSQREYEQWRETTEQWARRVATAHPELNGYTTSQLVAELCRREYERGDANRAERIERAVYERR